MARRALVIEDNADVAALLETILMSAGYEVETTPSGLAGVVRFSEATFDVVLLDMQIDDLSGPGAHRAIRDMCPQAAVICMSARLAGWADDALHQGATACLSKPFAPDDLIALLDALALGDPPLARAQSDVRALGPIDLARLAELSADELDALPFGAIRIDAEGRVTAFNAYESGASGRSPDAILGMRFSDLAPCTQVKQFVSCVEEGFAHRSMDRVLRFVFPRGGALCSVAVRLYYDPGFDQMWLFVSTVRAQSTESGSAAR